MADSIPPGHVGTLNPTQEDKLRQFWRVFMQSWDKSLEAPAAKDGDSASTKPQRKWFSLGRGPAPVTEEETAAIPPNLLSTLKGLDAGPNELRAINGLLKKFPGDEIRGAFFKMLKQDHPDGLLLRFLRAENWIVPKAWIKFVSALHWRVKEYRVDEEVVMKGEEYALRQARAKEDSAAKRDGEGFVAQLRTGKGHFHGADRWGRPLCVIRVRYHDPHAQTEKGLNDYIVHCSETARLLQTAPVETMTIVFDLTGFSLANWDFPPIKFIVKCFQDNYPESLGAMIFYNAPWIFSGFWKLIHGILDPVVASKVHFISGAKELEKLVPREHIIKELGGIEDWEYEYVEPDEHENDRLRDTATRDAMLAERNRLLDDLFRLTCDWIATPQAEAVRKSRGEVIRQLQDNYWKLDPYVRARSLMDRTGVIKEGGKIDFYPETTRNGQASVDESQAKSTTAPPDIPAGTATTNGDASAKAKVLEIEHAGDAPVATAVAA